MVRLISTCLFGAPTMEKNSEEEIVQFVDQYLTCSAATEHTAHLVELKTHKH